MRMGRLTNYTYYAGWQTAGFQTAHVSVGRAGVSGHLVEIPNLNGCKW
jgi:hypothetical protein